ncbi:bcl-2-like protein 2 [Ylistrum balloti]|uniref:bcl-2-like protein 2 n=1 Tax=Ylistrum balloti TaxID=509963 RepID=UPI002905B983|nr:bcl-2-like protein 2 [Ylistrum balloti]
MSLNNNIEMNPTSYRYLVVDFINYRLSRHGYTWDNCPPLEAQTNNVHRTLRALGDEFEERFRTQFDDMVNQLHITPNTAYPTFHQVVQELFIDGVNWGRIVALFGFGGAIAVDCVNKGMPHLVDSIVEWVSTYVENNLDQWVTTSGGWDGFVEFYEKGNARQRDSPWDNISGVIKYGMLGAMGAVALGAFLTQRT